MTARAAPDERDDQPRTAEWRHTAFSGWVTAISDLWQMFSFLAARAVLFAVELYST